MASDTVSHVLRMVRVGHVLVTAFAGLVSRRSHRMRFVTTAAVSMLTGPILCQDPRSLVTGGATKLGRRGKRVRLMAGRARIMPIAKRRGCQHLWLLHFVTLHAGGCVGGELVPPMTVGA